MTETKCSKVNMIPEKITELRSPQTMMLFTTNAKNNTHPFCSLFEKKPAVGLIFPILSQVMTFLTRTDMEDEADLTDVEDKDEDDDNDDDVPELVGSDGEEVCTLRGQITIVDEYSMVRPDFDLKSLELLKRSHPAYKDTILHYS
jgi:hypothetical protein